MACLAIFTAVAFFLEYHQNNKLNEVQFVIDLNNQFLNEGKMSLVEHDLERYFNAASSSTLCSSSISSSSTDDGNKTGKVNAEAAGEDGREKIAEELRKNYAPEKPWSYVKI